MVSYKQVILVRSDLEMGKGKIAAQVAHAAVDASLKAPSALLKAWRTQGMPKIVLKVNSLAELHKHKAMAEDLGLATAVITDAGHTQVEPGSVTCMAIGPGKEEEINLVVGKLKLL